MDETQWNSADFSKYMLSFLAKHGHASARKLRLFCCACCRRVWHSETHELIRRAVEVAERFADGSATDDERSTMLQTVAQRRELNAIAAKWALSAVARTGAIMVADVAGQSAACRPGQEYDPLEWENEWREQCDVLRDILGPLPFRQIVFEAAWRTPAVMELARLIYEERAFERMPELGRELRAGGCSDEEILGHCFETKQGKHWPGCFLLDLILGRA